MYKIFIHASVMFSETGGIEPADLVESLQPDVLRFPPDPPRWAVRDDGAVVVCIHRTKGKMPSRRSDSERKSRSRIVGGSVQQGAAWATLSQQRANEDQGRNSVHTVPT